MTDNQEPSEEDIRRKRLIFRSWHRGTKEMDLILGTFADTHVPFFSEEELTSYERILACTDPDLYDWISGKTPPPANMVDGVFQKILNRHAITKP